MRSKGCGVGVLLTALLPWGTAGVARSSGPAGKLMRCQAVVLEGEVRAGQELRRSFTGGLDLVLEPIASGWVVRVIPTRGSRGREDYAEVATPPYRSVSPLLLSTDFSFRAQDAIGWNPRRFRYAADARAFGRLEELYRKVTSTAKAAAADEAALGQLVSEQPEGELQILDASLTPGTADPTQAAQLLATHFAQTAHRIEQPGGGQTTPLGHIGSVRVRVRLELAAGAVPARGVLSVRSVCGGS